jgi:arylsulfatase A-like enzyme
LLTSISRLSVLRIFTASLICLESFPGSGLAGERSPAPQVELSKVSANAPNIVVVLLDDVGFSGPATFGGAIPTPTLDDLSGVGLRFNRFHTTGVCSPTRASLLTGRNSHVAGVGTVLNSASAHLGREGILKKSTATIATMLRNQGYATSAWGKWHLTPDWETSPSGPFDRWPTGVGFDSFYGFLGGETHQFEPTLYEGIRPVKRPDGADYHVSEDIAERAAVWMQTQKSVRPEKPLFVYFAPGATHAPLHAPKGWIERFKGKFNHGWDEERRQAFARQRESGTIPDDAILTPRPAEIPAWETLSDDQRKVASRLMEVYAGFLAHTDAQVGKLVSALREVDEFDNTLFIYIVGDNGASAEGGIYGGWNYFAGLMGMTEDVAKNMSRLDAFGGTDSFPHFPAGWAWATNTPFQWAKTVASHLGGTRNALVVSWPDGIRSQGELRDQWSHVNDIVPTILEILDVKAPKRVDGVEQLPMDGKSLVYSFDDASAESRHRTQYFEVFGHRAIYHEGWMASAFRGRAPWNVMTPIRHGFDEDQWELYDLTTDFSQGRDLAASHPERLRKLKKRFEKEAKKNSVWPLVSAPPGEGLPRLNEDRRDFVFYEGAIGIGEDTAPLIASRSYVVTADIEVLKGGVEGVIATEGGVVAGWALYVNAEGKPAYVYNLFDMMETTIVADRTLPVGRSTLRFTFDYDGGGPGRGGMARLFLGDDEIGNARIPRTTPMFSIDETFDVGTDTGSPAGAYPPNYDFTGRIRSVKFELGMAH